MTLYCQVNDTDYDGRAVVEVVDYYADGPAVPAWDEWGHPDLAGEYDDLGACGFKTNAEARAALEREHASDPAIGIYFMPERDCPRFD